MLSVRCSKKVRELSTRRNYDILSNPPCIMHNRYTWNVFTYILMTFRFMIVIWVICIEFIVADILFEKTSILKCERSFGFSEQNSRLIVIVEKWCSFSRRAPINVKVLLSNLLGGIYDKSSLFQLPPFDCHVSIIRNQMSNELYFTDVTDGTQWNPKGIIINSWSRWKFSCKYELFKIEC